MRSDTDCLILSSSFSSRPLADPSALNRAIRIPVVPFSSFEKDPTSLLEDKNERLGNKVPPTGPGKQSR